MDHLVCISVNNVCVCVCVCVYSDAIFTSVLCVGLNLLESYVNNVLWLMQTRKEV